MKTRWDFDCAVIGGGPAGLAASLYLARFRRSTAIFEFGTPRVRWAPRIQNLMGYPKSIAGTELLRRYREHLRKYPQVKRVHAKAAVLRHGRGFAIETPTGERYLARKVVLATGVSDAHPALKNLDALRKKGFLRYCSICDGYEMKNRRIAVFAKDDEGLQKALFLSNWTKKIDILVPTKFRPTRTRTRQLEGAGLNLVHSDRIELRIDGKKPRLMVHGCDENAFECEVAYVELGGEVKTGAFAKLRGLKKVEGGFLVATAEQRTSIPGLFAAGDCVNRLGQVSVALGEAAIAATNVHHELMRF